MDALYVVLGVVGIFLMGLMVGMLVAKRQWQKGEWY